jgi:hypothetical protein
MLFYRHIRCFCLRGCDAVGRGGKKAFAAELLYYPFFQAPFLDVRCIDNVLCVNVGAP